jgi:hypothetical protein
MGNDVFLNIMGLVPSPLGILKKPPATIGMQDENRF